MRCSTLKMHQIQFRLELRLIAETVHSYIFGSFRYVCSSVVFALFIETEEQTGDRQRSRYCSGVQSA